MKSLGGSDSEKAGKAENTVSAGADAAVSASSVKLDLSKVKIEPLFEDFVDFDTFSKSDFRVVKVKGLRGSAEEQEASAVHTG